MGPTDGYAKAWKPIDQLRFFSLLLPLSTAVFSTIMAKRKFRAEELEAQAESNFVFEPVSSLWHCINPSTSPGFCDGRASLG
jgi:hypothetical protein